MKKKSRITAILLSVVMIFAMTPLTAGVVFANGDGGDGNEGEGVTTDPVKTVILEPGTIGGDPVEVHSNDPGAMAESEEAAANGQFFVYEGKTYYKLPDLPDTFVPTAGVEFKGWVINHAIIPFFNSLSNPGDPKGFGQNAETMTVTALWRPKGANIDPLAGLTFMYYDEEETATVIGYDASDPDDMILIPISTTPGLSKIDYLVTEIGRYAFQYMDTSPFDSSYSLMLPYCIKVIGHYACYHAGFLDSVTFPDSVRESQLERIGNYAFAKCPNLASVEIPGSVKTIGKGAFADCDNLQSAVYMGTKEEWSKVTVGEGNEALTNVLSFQYTQINNVVLSKTSYTYNGKVQKPSIKTICGKSLKEGTDYEAKWSNNSSKNAGTYTVTVTGKGDYKGTGTAKYTIAKASNTMKIKAKTATVKRSAVKEKAQTLAVSKVIAFTNKGQGAKTYVKKSGNNKITINKITGKVTVKKGLKKGTYKVKVKVKAKGNTNYKASAVKTVTFTIRIK